MTRENETKRVFGDNPVTRPARRDFDGQARMNTFEKLTALKQPERQDISSRILTTPESIVRKHRAQVLQAGPILGRVPEPVPWQARIDWDFVQKMISYACGFALGLVGFYVLAWGLIRFCR